MACPLLGAACVLARARGRTRLRGAGLCVAPQPVVCLLYALSCTVGDAHQMSVWPDLAATSGRGAISHTSWRGVVHRFAARCVVVRATACVCARAAPLRMCVAAQPRIAIRGGARTAVVMRGGRLPQPRRLCKGPRPPTDRMLQPRHATCAPRPALCCVGVVQHVARHWHGRCVLARGALALRACGVATTTRRLCARRPRGVVRTGCGGRPRAQLGDVRWHWCGCGGEGVASRRMLCIRTGYARVVA